MSDEQTYAVNDDVDFRVESGFVDVLKYNDSFAAVFGSPDLVNIRRAKDTSKGSKTLPAVSVSCVPAQSIARTNEYHFRVQILCQTQADADQDGQQEQSLAGAVRAALHEDSTLNYVSNYGTAHFKGDHEGFVEAFNKTERGIVLHQVHETTSEEAPDGRNRGTIVNADAWGYPGAVS